MVISSNAGKNFSSLHLIYLNIISCLIKKSHLPIRAIISYYIPYTRRPPVLRSLQYRHLQLAEHEDNEF